MSNMTFSPDELDMARKGYVYYAQSVTSNGMRKCVKVLTNEKRSDLIFDRPAYEAHGK